MSARPTSDSTEKSDFAIVAVVFFRLYCHVDGLVYDESTINKHKLSTFSYWRLRLSSTITQELLSVIGCDDRRIGTRESPASRGRDFSRRTGRSEAPRWL